MRIVANGRTTRVVPAFDVFARFGAEVGRFFVVLSLSLGILIGFVPPLMGANPVVVENQQPGTTQWQLWQSGYRAADDVSKQIKGYASATSVNKGETITFYVTVNPVQSYTIDIYRIGWYQGNGGHFMQRIGPISGSQQPACPINAATGLTECGWAPAHTLVVPTTWTSGVYLALLTNSQNYQNYIDFVIRDDSRVAALLYQQSVTTYQAYNTYPNDGTGKSLYDYNSSPPKTLTGTTRAVKVSFDRPYSNNGDGQFLMWEVYFVRWLERWGYDVTYSTDVDTHANGARLLNYKGFLSVGHDEYWSQAMYNAVQLARDSGVNLGFFGANSVYWQVRFEPSTGTAVPNRVMVCYKSLTLDPVQGSTTTVTWRDLSLNRPEQGLIGIQSTAQISSDITQTIPYVVTNSSHWVYSGTGFSNGNSVPQVVGYETDRYVSGYPLPAYAGSTYTLLSQSPFFSSIENTSDYSNSSIYQALSGAWVFAAGTISWAWALDKAGIVDPRMQTTTANILNKFISAGSAIPPNAPSGLSGTAISASQINLTWTSNSTNETNMIVERALTSAFTSITSVSLPAGTTSFSDTGLAAATTYYYRVKAINGAGNSPYSNVANATTQGSPPPVTPYTIWPSTATPAVLDVGPEGAVELGVSFRADVNGSITGLRFYKSSGNTGVHVGNLWTSSGALLATATFTNETASGWQQVNFANPVAITANTLYVASYHSTIGHFSVTNNYFAGSGVDNAPLHVPANSPGTPNGRYYYGATSGFPVNTYLSSNYWVDVVFTK